MNFIKVIAVKFPQLQNKLRQAQLADSPEYYIKKNIMLGVFTSLALTFILFGFLKSIKVILFTPIIAIVIFLYFMKYVDMQIVKQDKLIAREIVFAVRFLIVELDSGVPLYRAFRNIAQNYEALGKIFNEIILNIDLGVPMVDAINQAIEYTPSADLRKVLWQLLNTIKTGAPVISALQNVLNQIIREQKIAVTEYGRKLNPLAMFYMMIAIIVPSLGTVMLVIMATFIGFKLSLTLLLSLVFLLGFVQFMFLSIVKSARPPVDI